MRNYKKDNEFIQTISNALLEINKPNENGLLTLQPLVDEIISKRHKIFQQYFLSQTAYSN